MSYIVFFFLLDINSGFVVCFRFCFHFRSFCLPLVLFLFLSIIFKVADRKRDKSGLRFDFLEKSGTFGSVRFSFDFKKCQVFCEKVQQTVGIKARRIKSESR